MAGARKRRAGNAGAVGAPPAGCGARCLPCCSASLSVALLRARGLEARDATDLQCAPANQNPPRPCIWRSNCWLVEAPTSHEALRLGKGRNQVQSKFRHAANRRWPVEREMCDGETCAWGTADLRSDGRRCGSRQQRVMSPPDRRLPPWYYMHHRCGSHDAFSTSSRCTALPQARHITSRPPGQIGRPFVTLAIVHGAPQRARFAINNTTPPDRRRRTPCPRHPAPTWSRTSTATPIGWDDGLLIGCMTSTSASDELSVRRSLCPRQNMHAGIISQHAPACRTKMKLT